MFNKYRNVLESSVEMNQYFLTLSHIGACCMRPSVEQAGDEFKNVIGFFDSTGTYVIMNPFLFICA